MKRWAIALITLPLLTACGTIDWQAPVPNDTAASDARRGQCRPSTASDPVARGEWVCENSTTGEVQVQRENPIYD